MHAVALTDIVYEITKGLKSQCYKIRKTQEQFT